jgi:hypothetical protein
MLAARFTLERTDNLGGNPTAVKLAGLRPYPFTVDMTLQRRRVKGYMIA